MYPAKRIGKGTKLDPVITVDGVNYSYGVKFGNQGPSGQSIVAGTIHSVSDEGGGYKKIVFDRDFQTSSETVVDSAGATLRVKRHSMGGNIVQAPEPQHLADFGNDGFRSGPRYDKRALVGDRLEVDGRSFNITDAKAYGEAPASVDYSGDPVASNSVTRSDPVFQYPAPPTGADTLIIDADVEPFAIGAGLFRHNGTATSLIALQRAEFNPDDDSRYTYPFPAASDSFHLPADAAFSTSDPVQHWVDPDNFSVRVADLLSSKTIQGLYAGYYIQSASYGPFIYKQDGEDFVANTPLPLVLAGAGTGFDTGNSVYDVTHLVENAGSVLGISRTYRVNKVGGLAGIGVFFAFDESFQSQKYLVALYDAGTVYVQARTATTTTTLATFPAGDSFEVRIDKTNPAAPTTYTLSTRPDSLSPWTTRGSADFPDEPPSRVFMGALAAANGTINFTPATMLHGCEMLHVYGAANDASRASYYRAHSAALTTPRQTVDFSDETTALVSVTNQTTGSAMTASATAGRGRYAWDAGTKTLTLYPESRGDTIATQFAAPASTSAPGDFPSALSRGGLADTWVNDDGTVANNRANWRDYVIVHDPNDEIDSGMVGMTASISRDPVWDSTRSYQLFYSPQDSIVWTQISGDQMLVDYAAGAAIFRETWVDANLDDGTDYVFHPSGPVYVQTNGLDAQTANQIGSCFESLDRAWTPMPFPAGSGSVAFNVFGGMSLGPTQVEPLGLGFLFSGYAYGHTNKGLAELDPTQTIQTSAPGSGTVLASWEAYDWTYRRQPSLDGANPIWAGASQEADPIEDVTDGSGNTTSTSQLIKKDAFWWFQTYGPASSFPYSVRSTAGVGSTGLGEITMGSYAEVGPFTLPAWMTRLPAGSTILEAKVRVRVAAGGGQRRVSFISNNPTRLPWANGGVSEFKFTVNGVVVSHVKAVFVEGTGWTETINISNPDPGYETDRIDLALAVYGRRRRSGAVPIPDKTATALGYSPSDFPIYQNNPDQGEIRFLGTLPAAQLTPDVDQIIDATSYIQTLVDSREPELSDYFLYPLGGRAAAPDDWEAAGAAGLIAGLIPEITVDEERNGTQLSRNITIDGLHELNLPTFPTFGEGHVRFRLPSGIIDEINRPLAMPQLSA